MIVFFENWQFILTKYRNPMEIYFSY